MTDYSLVPELEEVGFKSIGMPNKIVPGLITILGSSLCDPSFDINNSDDHYQLQMRIYIYLSQSSFRRTLLFVNLRPDSASDAATSMKIHKLPAADGCYQEIAEQAIIYFTDVLNASITVVKPHKGGPTNMHRLLARMCQFGRSPHPWHETSVERDKNAKPTGLDSPVFRRIALTLKHQRDKLGDNYKFFSDSKNQINKHGSLWLKSGDFTCELPEEMSLFDVLKALPTPLDNSFYNDREFQRLFCAVIDSLNERYGLLRKCGLDPYIWLNRTEPKMNELKQMGQLTRVVKEREKQLPSHDRLALYELVYNELKGDKPKFSGCSHFNELVNLEWGFTMMHNRSPWSDQWWVQKTANKMDSLVNENTTDGYTQYIDTAASHHDRTDEPADRGLIPSTEVTRIIEKNKHIFSNNQLMEYYFFKIYLKGMSITDPRIEDDKTFKALLKAERLDHLNKQLRNNEIVKRAMRLAKEMMNR